MVIVLNSGFKYYIKHSTTVMRICGLHQPMLKIFKCHCKVKVNLLNLFYLHIEKV